MLTALCDAVDPSGFSTHAVVRSTLTSLGQLRFSHKELVDGAAGWMTQNLEGLEQRDLVTFAITTAALNYVPANSDPIFQAIRDKVTYEGIKSSRSGSPGSELIWLDVVWSLAVLDKHEHQQLASVLSPEYYNKLLCEFAYSTYP